MPSKYSSDFAKSIAELQAIYELEVNDIKYSHVMDVRKLESRAKDLISQNSTLEQVNEELVQRNEWLEAECKDEASTKGGPCTTIGVFNVDAQRTVFECGCPKQEQSAEEKLTDANKYIRTLESENDLLVTELFDRDVKEFNEEGLIATINDLFAPETDTDCTCA